MDNFMMEDLGENTYRIKREENSASERVSMRFTRDERLIKQYRQLRKDLYEIDPRFVGFRMFNDASAEHYEDPDDQMLVVLRGNEVVGGACLRVSTPQHPIMLDLENDILPDSDKFYFSLRERLPDLQLHQYAFAEFNRIVLHPSLRKGRVTRSVFQTILERCIDHRVRYIFSLSDSIRSRLYCQIYRNAGIVGGIREDVNVPMRSEYEGIKMHLVCGDMKRFHAVPSDPDAKILLKPSIDFSFD